MTAGSGMLVAVAECVPSVHFSSAFVQDSDREGPIYTLGIRPYPSEDRVQNSFNVARAFRADLEKLADRHSVVEMDESIAIPSHFLQPSTEG